MEIPSPHPLHVALLTELRSRVMVQPELGRVALAAVESIGSTMDLARELQSEGRLREQLSTRVSERAEQGGSALLEQPLIVVALEQVRGRGRLERSWRSGSGEGLYATVIFDTPRPAAFLRGLPLALGVGVLRAVREFGCDARLKWPNDLWTIDHRGNPKGKLAGILVESWGTSSATRVSCGMGINLSPSAKPLPFLRSSLEELAGRVLPYEAVFGEVASRVFEVLVSYLQSGLGPFTSEWEANSLTQRRRVRGVLGDREVIGEAVGLEEEGGLRVRVAGGDHEVVVHSNEISLVDF